MSDDRTGSSEVPDIDEVMEHFYRGLQESEIQRRLSVIGFELNKVRKYANEWNTDSDLISQSIVFLTLSAYFAGLVPLVRIEGALFVEKNFRNEYAYALVARAYVEVAGRIHKGLRLWRLYKSGVWTIADFNNGTKRLMGRHQSTDLAAPYGYFKDNGFNVMTLIDSLDDKIPAIQELYGQLSCYTHGDFSYHMMSRQRSLIADLRLEDSFLIGDIEKELMVLRDVIFDDFDELLNVTKELRERYDRMHHG